MARVTNIGAVSALKRIADITAKNRELIDFNVKTYRTITSSFKTDTISHNAIIEIANRQASLFEQISPLRLKVIKPAEVFAKQWETIGKISTWGKTPEINNLHSSLMKNDYSGIPKFLKTFNKTKIDARNLSFLRRAKIFENIDYTYTKGLNGIMRGLHVDTAEKLATSTKIIIDIPSKVFYVKGDPNKKATLEETNILCSGMKLLSGISAEDLIDFMNFLDENPTLALSNDTGKNIFEIVGKWDEFIDFDYDFFYHARALKDITKPYNENELRKAPKGVTWHGRFNHVGQSHYYFSNEEKGAKLEVAKHTTDEKFIQIAKMKPVKKIKMVDLSVGLTEKNKFLEYCRMGLPKNDLKIKREYLIPCFFADCCKGQGIQGIKYYGSKEYKNYVSWEDSYFDYIDSKIQTLE